MKKELPLLTVIIATYDSERTIEKCLVSIKNQTYLARLAFSYDIRHEKRLILRLERLCVRLEEQKKKFEKILNNLSKNFKDLPKVVEQFKAIVQESEKDIEGAFFYSYKIKKRDFLLIAA